MGQGLPGPLPRAFRAVRVPNGPKPRKTDPFQEPSKAARVFGLSGAAKKTFQNPPQPSSQTASNSIMGLMRRLESTSNLIDGYDRHAGRPTFGFARPPLRFARGDSSTLTASAPPDTEASQQVTAGSGRIKHGGPAKGRASATTHS